MAGAGAGAGEGEGVTGWRSVGEGRVRDDAAMQGSDGGAGGRRHVAVAGRDVRSGLLAVLDDIATVLDDVALLTKVAAKKTAGSLY